MRLGDMCAQATKTGRVWESQAPTDWPSVQIFGDGPTRFAANARPTPRRQALVNMRSTMFAKSAGDPAAKGAGAARVL